MGAEHGRTARSARTAYEVALACLVTGLSVGCPRTSPDPSDEYLQPVCPPEVSAVSGDAVDESFPGYRPWYGAARPARLALALDWNDGGSFPAFEALDVGVVVPADPTVFTATFAEASGCVTRHYAVDRLTADTVGDDTPWTGDSWVSFDEGQIVRWRAAVASPQLDGTSLDGRWRDMVAGAGVVVLTQAPTLVAHFEGTPTEGDVRIFAAPAGDESHQITVRVATGRYVAE